MFYKYVENYFIIIKGSEIMISPLIFYEKVMIEKILIDVILFTMKIFVLNRHIKSNFL